MPQISLFQRDVRGTSCAVGNRGCSHVCEAGGKAPCDGLLVPLPPKSRGLQLHHDADRIRRRVALGSCVHRPGHSAEFGERVAGADDPDAAVQTATAGHSAEFGERVAGADDPDAAVQTATAGESERIIRLHEVSVSDFPPLLRSSQSPNSCLGSWSSACARSVARRVAAAPARVCPGSSSSAVSAAVAHAHASVLHGASVNSWSDTVRLHGPTCTRRVKGGVSRPAEDLRPVSEVEAGVNFRPAGRVRGQVAGSLPGKQPGAGSRPIKGSVVTPSLHPEVPDSLSVSPGPGKRIRQLMGWTKVCETALSGIWVLKGNARACMLPANLDYLRVGWRKQGSYKTAWVTPGHDCLCSYKYGHGAAVRPQTNKAIWDGVISLWGRVAPFLSPWCGQEGIANGGELEPLRWFKIMRSLA